MKIQLSKFNFKEKSFLVLLFVLVFTSSIGINQVSAQAPSAVDDVYSDVLVTGGPFFIPVLGNDNFGPNGPNSGSISVNPVLLLGSGNAFSNANGTPNNPTDDTIEFTPDVNYVGPVSIEYTIEDSTGATDTAAVTFNVLPASELSITQAINAGPYNVGDNVTFTLTVTNNGPSDATGVAVVDKLPDGFSFVSSFPAASYNAASGLWDLGNLSAVGPNNVTTLEIVATINANGSYRNIAEITAANEADPNGVVHGNNTPGEIDQSEETIIPNPVSDLVTTILVDNNTPSEGDTITYTIKVENSGPSNATNVRLTDALPAGVTYLGNDLGADYNPLNGVWTIGNLANGASVTINITATVDNGTAGNTITNSTLVAESNEIDPTIFGDDLDVDITVALGDIVLTKTVNNTSPNVGDTVTYIIIVENRGLGSLTNLVVRDPQPAGLTFTNVTPSEGIWTAPNWDIGNLAPGQQQTLMIEAVVGENQGGQTITNTATHTQDQTDASLPSEASADIIVTSTDLVTTKTVVNADATLTTYSEGDEIIYTITVNHDSGDDATNVSLTDKLPQDITYVSYIASQGFYDSNLGVWTIGDIANGSAPITLEIRARINSGTATNTITNITSVAKGDQSDPTTAGDDLEETITIANDSDIVLTKIVNNQAPNVGETVTYTITVANNGPALVTNLVVRDPQPAGLTFKSVTPSEGIWDAINEEWSVGNLEVNESQTLQIQAVVGENQGGQTITNTATHTQDQTDASLPSEASADIIVTSTDLVTTKTVVNADATLTTYSEGDEIIYTITVNHDSGDDATNVSLTDKLPQDITYVSYIASQGFYDSNLGVWTIGDIANGSAPITLEIRARINSGTATNTITNITSVAKGDQSDPTTAGDDLEETITIANDSDIVLTKIVNNQAPNVGETVTYTITVANNGPALVTNLVVRDPQPAGLTFTSVTPSEGIWDAINEEWSVGNLEVNESQTLQIQAVVGVNQGGQTITNTATHTQDQTDASLPSEASADIIVTSTDLVTTKTVVNADATLTTYSEGDEIIYTITVNHDSGDDATNVSLTDKLPQDITYVSYIASQGFYDSNSGVWTIGDIANGSTPITLEIRATIDAGTAGTNIENIITAAQGDQSDPTTVGDDLEETITIANESDIVITKTVDNPAPNAGDTVIYTITVKNNGPALVTNLQVSDPQPIGLTFSNVTLSEGSWSVADQEWTVGNLRVNESQTLQIEALVGVNQGGQTIVNTVTHLQDQVDSDVTLDDLEEVIIVTSTDLVTTKTVVNADPALTDYNEGDEIIYTITVENLGPDDATNVSLTDQLPIGVTYVSDDSNGTYDRVTGLWDIGDITNLDTVSLEIRATIDSGTAGTSIINRTTAAKGDQSEPNPVTTIDILEAPITVLNETDIVLTKIVDNPTPNAGDTVTYTVTVRNNGPITATNLNIEDSLPTGLTFGDAVASEGTWTAPVWYVGDLAPGEEQNIKIEVIVDPNITVVTPIPIVNTVFNTQDQIDNNNTLDDSEEIITVTSVDLVTQKTVANADPALTDYNEGDEIIYTITVENLGPSDATNVSLTDQLPIGVTYVSDDSNGAYDRVTGLWNIGDITNLDTVSLEIRATIDSGTAGTNIINRTTAAKGDQSEPNPATTIDILEAPINVLNETDIVLTKTVDNPNPNAGDTVIYTVTVRNNGPVSATNLRITDNLPTGLTFGTAIASEGTWTQPIWFIGNLAPNEEQIIKIEAIVDPNITVVTPISITNTVSNTQDQIDNDNTLDDLEEIITVTSSDLAVTKRVDNPSPNEGDTIVYTIEVTNNGPSEATNVSLTDLLPVGVTYVSSTATQGDYNNGSGLWVIGDIPNTITATLEITTTVDSGALGRTIINSISALTADQSDPDLSNNDASVSIVPTSNIDLSLTKTVLNNDVAPEIGSTITFEIIILNNGPTKATGVDVRDLLPSGYDFIRYSSTKGQYDSATGLWNIGSIEVDDAEVLLLDVIVLDSGIYENCAQVIGTNEIDIDNTNDRDCTTVIPVPEVDVDLDLSIEKTVVANNTTPQVGTEISFEVRLINSGEIKGVGIVVTDQLPDGYTFLKYSSTKGAYDNQTGEWVVGTILEGDTEILIIDVIVNATGDYENCAEITLMNQTEADITDNLSCITTNPISIIDLEVTKEVALSLGSEGSVSTTGILQPYAESNVDFTITVSNNGPSDASGVQILELLPSGYDFVSTSTSVGSFDEGSGIWDIGNIATGVSETLTITAYVNPAGNWLNVVEVIAANELDLDSTPNNGDLLEDDMAQIATAPIVALTIPEGFTPNGDGINDVFEIEHLEILYPNFSMEIVNRYGKRVYEYKHNGDPFETPLWWDGSSTGFITLPNDQVPTGTYFFTIYFNNNERKPQTGWVYIRK